MDKNASYQKYYSILQFSLGVLVWLFIILVGPGGALDFEPEGTVLHGLDPRLSQGLFLVLLLGFSWSAMRFRFRLPSGYFVSFDIAFAVAAFLLISPLVAVLVALVSLWVDHIDRMREGFEGRWILYLNNMGNRALRFGAAWIAFALFGGHVPISGDSNYVFQAFAAFAAYFLTNNLFFLPMEYLQGGNLKSFLKETFTVDLGYSALTCAFGYIMALTTTVQGFWVFLLLAGVVVGASWLLSRLWHTQAELKRNLEDLLAISQVNAAASSGLDMLPMVEAFTRKLAEVLNADGIGVIFYQPYSTTLSLVQCEGEKSRATYLPEETQFQYNELPLSDPSTRLGERLFEFLQPLETAPFFVPPSCYGIPLLHAGEPFGGIVVYSYSEGKSFSAKKSLLETCAQSLVVGLENCFLHLQAIQDPLTGLFNRSYFFYRLEEEISYSVRHEAPFSLLMIDLDDFKAVNDFLGHAQGDKVLHRIGDLLRRSLRREDVPARFGGDEFIILMVKCGEGPAMKKAEQIRRIISSKALPKEEAEGLSIGCSIGVLISTQLRGEQDVPTLLRRLDKALYKAKGQGKNQIVVAD